MFFKGIYKSNLFSLQQIREEILVGRRGSHSTRDGFWLFDLASGADMTLAATGVVSSRSFSHNLTFLCVCEQVCAVFLCKGLTSENSALFMVLLGCSALLMAT